MRYLTPEKFIIIRQQLLHLWPKLVKPALSCNGNLNILVCALWSRSSPKSIQLLLVTYPAPLKTFVKIYQRLFELYMWQTNIQMQKHNIHVRCNNCGNSTKNICRMFQLLHHDGHLRHNPKLLTKVYYKITQLLMLPSDSKNFDESIPALAHGIAVNFKLRNS